MFGFICGVCLLLVPGPHWLDDCGFGTLPEVWESHASCLDLVPQDGFGKSGSSGVPNEVWDCLFWFCGKHHGSFDRDRLELVDCLG